MSITTKNNLNKTVYVKQSHIEKNRKRYAIDAKNRVLGDIASTIAYYLQGKHQPHIWDARDAGDFVIVKNARDVVVTGRKYYQKMYYKHTGYKGHLRVTPYEDIIHKDPVFVIEHAVRGMLPKNKLRDRRMKRLKVLVDDDTARYDNFSFHELT